MTAVVPRLNLQALRPAEARAHDVFSAIERDDAKSLRNALRAFDAGVSHETASKFAARAWHCDLAKHPKTASLVEAKHMLSTLYTALAEGPAKAYASPPLYDGYGSASLLLFTTAVGMDDDTLLPLAWVWGNGKFCLSRPADGEERGDAIGFERATRSQILSLLTRERAFKCATWYTSFAWGPDPREPALKAKQTSVRVVPPDRFGGQRMSTMYVHPWHERARTLEHDPRKTVLLVQFDLGRDASRRVVAGATRQVEALTKRSEAIKLLKDDDYVLLEVCNMRAAFLDAAQDAAIFAAVVERVARACGLVVVEAARRVDPGPGLLLLNRAERITFA